MVDEREAAAGPALAVAAAEQAPDAADGPDASIDSEDGSDKNPGTSSPPASRTAAPSNKHTDRQAGCLPLGVRRCARTAAAASTLSASSMIVHI